MAEDFVSNYRGAKSRLDAQNAVKKSLPTRGSIQKERAATNSAKGPSQNAWSPSLLDVLALPLGIITVNGGGSVAPAEKKLPEKQPEINWNQVNNLLDQRGAYSYSENPANSLDVEIPMTSNVRKIQAGKLRIINDVNKSGINRDNALYIVGNTYQDNDDGTHYGMGWDGRPYSYKIEGDEVKDFTLLDADEHKRAIERLTNGGVKVDSSIDNTGTLAQIYRSIKKMQDFQKGNLSPKQANISDPDPGYGDSHGLVGYTYTDRDTGKNNVLLFNADFPGLNNAREAYEKGAAPINDEDHVTAHELSHVVDFERIDAAEKYNKLHNIFEDNGGNAFDMFKQAAKNTGFKNVEDAVASISSYALNDAYEAFAEAYVDVLYNKGNAKPFSKELIRLYNDQVDRLAKLLGPKDAEAFRKEYGLGGGLMTQKQLNDAVVNYEQIKRNNNPFPARNQF